MAYFDQNKCVKGIVRTDIAVNDWGQKFLFLTQGGVLLWLEWTENVTEMGTKQVLVQKILVHFSKIATVTALFILSRIQYSDKPPCKF